MRHICLIRYSKIFILTVCSCLESVHVFMKKLSVFIRWCGCVVESVLTLLPAGERSAVAATTNIDLQWLADRSSSVWTGGKNDSCILLFFVSSIYYLKW